MSKTTTAAGVLAAATLGVVGLAHGFNSGEEGTLHERTSQPGQQAGMAEMLVSALKATPGCLGTDLAQTQSGKNCIMAWFKDKESVKTWYYSRTHQMVMTPMLVPGEQRPEPLEHVKDGSGPILVIATITPGGDNTIEGFPMPISQISIELFSPLPGGAHVNGRLSPEGFEVPHMDDYSPKSE